MSGDDNIDQIIPTRLLYWLSVRIQMEQKWDMTTVMNKNKHHYILVDEISKHQADTTK